MKEQQIVYAKRELAMLGNCVVTKKLKDILDETERSLEALRDRATEKPYALVLVDGSDYMFHTRCLRHGLEGGIAAGQQLIERVHDYFQDRNIEDHRSWLIMVRVVADVDDWADKAVKCGLLVDSNEVRDFGIGLTQAAACVDFVVIAGEKEIFDRKLKWELEYHLPSVGDRCKHVTLACSKDHGMLGMLDPYKDNTR